MNKYNFCRILLSSILSFYSIFVSAKEYTKTIENTYIANKMQENRILLLSDTPCEEMPEKLFPDTVLCMGDALFIPSNFSAYTPLWSNGDTTTYLFAQESGNFMLYLKSSNPECPDLQSDTFYLNVINDKDLLSSGILPELLCADDTIYLNPPSKPYCNWTWEALNLAPNFPLAVDTAGIYPFIYTHRCGKSVLDTFLVYTAKNPSLSLQAQLTNPIDTLTPCIGENVLLNAQITDTLLYNERSIIASSGEKYLWYNGINDSVCKIQYQGDSAFWVWVETTDRCQTSLHSDSIYFIYKAPYVYLGADTLLCHSDSLSLNAYGDLYRYAWKMEGTTKIDTQPTYTVHPPGGKLSIEVRLQDATPSACIARDTIEVLYYSFADISWEEDIDTLICHGEKFILAPSSSDQSFLYTWGHLDSLDLGDQFLHSGNSLQIQDSGSYKVWIQNHCSIDSGYISLHYYPYPEKKLSLDTFLCYQDSLRIDFESPYIHYLWENGDTSALRYIYADSMQSHTKGSLYTVSMQSICTNYPIVKDSIEIIYLYPPLFSLIQDTFQCRDTETEIEMLMPDFYLPAYQFLWQDGSTESTYMVSDSGWYSLTVHQALCNLQHTDSVYFAYIPWAWTNINYPEDTSVCENLEFILDVQNANKETRYTWSDDENLSSPIRHLSQNLTTELTLSDTMGCTNTQTISVRFEECKALLETPNVITPNGDGINDVFTLKTAEKITDFEFKIFNAWGINIFSYKGDPLALSWDAKQKMGQSAPDGAYFFLATFKDMYGKKMKQSGCIMVLR